MGVAMRFACQCLPTGSVIPQHVPLVMTIMIRCPLRRRGDKSLNLNRCILFVALIAPVGAAAQENASPEPTGRETISATVHPGGTMRYGANRWGLLKASVTNDGLDAQAMLVVVTPPGSEGLQYARRVEVPARSVFDTSFPVRIDHVDSGNHEIRYLVFPGGEDAGELTQPRNDDLLPSLMASIGGTPIGAAGWIAHPREPFETSKVVGGLLRALRYEQQRNAAVVVIVPLELTGSGEGLDALDAIGVSSSELIHDHHACDSIRLWLHRGGRLLLFLDQTGPELAEVLLGDALPMRVVGETSANSVRLDLNPDFRKDRYPVRSVTRDFDEPIHWLRVQFESGSPLWSVEGWPVAVQAPVGAGSVVVTTINPAVFIRGIESRIEGDPGFSLIESSRPMVNAMFMPRSPPVLDEAVVTIESAAAVGYQIPSQRTGAMLALIFPALLLIVGGLVMRRASGQRLIWIVPVLAIIGSLPALIAGIKTRAVAPETLIETELVVGVPGAKQQTSTGYATFYSQRPSVVTTSTMDGSLLENRADAMNRDYRRLVSTDGFESHWENLTQPSGLRTFSTRAVHQHQRPLRAVVTFDEDGLVGTLLSGDSVAPEDALFAGLSSDRLSVTISASESPGSHSLSATVADVLPPNQFVTGSLMTDVQRRRAALLAAAFGNRNRLESFPAVPSLLYWDVPENSTLTMGGDSTRHDRSALVVLPIQFKAPEVGQTVTLPSPLMPYRSVATSDGGISSAFDNNRRQWVSQESSSNTLLQFDLPDVCLPFAPESAVAELLIRAGSRTVTVSAGAQDGMTVIQTLSSPLGTQQITIPVELISASCRTGSLLLQIDVSDLDSGLKSADATGEQDDSWSVERLLLTLRGKVEGP